MVDVIPISAEIVRAKGQGPLALAEPWLHLDGGGPGGGGHLADPGCKAWL